MDVNLLDPSACHKIKALLLTDNEGDCERIIFSVGMSPAIFIIYDEFFLIMTSILILG